MLRGSKNIGSFVCLFCSRALLVVIRKHAISDCTNANQMKLVSTLLFSEMRNLLLLLLVHIFTTGWHYKQLNTISTKILTHTKFLD